MTALVERRSILSPDPPTACAHWEACCCRRGADGHCWRCGRQHDEHAEERNG